MKKNVKVWGFGHTHHSSSQIHGSTKVVSNQLGYIKSNQHDQNFSNVFTVFPFGSLKEGHFGSRGHYEISDQSQKRFKFF